ncbi:MAG: hypothetical protein AAF730_15300 [Bacteroidota bacterium]
MSTIPLPTEFSELLKLLHAHEVRYLVVGGYAVAYHGYPRTTGDIDIWIERSRDNAERIYNVLLNFGFDVPELRAELFEQADRVIRMGYPPLRVEILTSISGVEFSDCYPKRIQDDLGGTRASIIELDCLKTNKRASGRHKDLSDLGHLP